MMEDNTQLYFNSTTNNKSDEKSPKTGKGAHKTNKKEKSPKGVKRKFQKINKSSDEEKEDDDYRDDDLQLFTMMVPENEIIRGTLSDWERKQSSDSNHDNQEINSKKEPLAIYDEDETPVIDDEGFQTVKCSVKNKNKRKANKKKQTI